MDQDEVGDQVTSWGGLVIDLSERVRAREQQATRRPEPERVAFSLFMIVSRLTTVRDHALFYLFLDGAPTMIAVASFAREHKNLFGSDISIIDLKERFGSPIEVVEAARHLRETAPGATVLAPDLGLGPRLVRNG